MLVVLHISTNEYLQFSTQILLILTFLAFNRLYKAAVSEGLRRIDQLVFLFGDEKDS